MNDAKIKVLAKIEKEIYVGYSTEWNARIVFRTSTPIDVLTVETGWDIPREGNEVSNLKNFVPASLCELSQMLYYGKVIDSSFDGSEEDKLNAIDFIIMKLRGEKIDEDYFHHYPNYTENNLDNWEFYIKLQ